MKRVAILLVCLLVCLLVSPGPTLAAKKNSRTITEQDIAALNWRAIGPANMGGRVAAIALVPGSRTSFYVGFATGGLFKSDNLGTTFQECALDGKTSSIGAIAVASAPDSWAGWDRMAAEGDTVALADRVENGQGKVVWVGTGEGNGRNSSSWGAGVYLSTDGGGSFQNVGLAATHNIPRIAVDPANPDVCYVAALGHLWGANSERGIFRTTDAGQSWDHVLKIDAEVGACDVLLDPSNSNTVFAAMYKAHRTPWSFAGFSPDGGIYRSDDGGSSWTKLTSGLPAVTGRIGLAIFPGDSNLIYAVVESNQGGVGRSAWDDRSPAGGLFRSQDRGDTWTRVNELNFRPFYFSRLAVDPLDPELIYMPGWDLAISHDGGRTFRRSGSQNVHVDHHAIAIDPEDPQRIFLGNDGGLYVSHDGAKSWDLFNHVNLGQFYHVAADNGEPYRVGGGLQDNGSWVGPSATRFKSGAKNQAGILNEDWRAVYGGDGFRVLFDREDPDIIYASSQGGNLGRVHLDSQLVVPLRAGADEGMQRLRFNWDAPFVISHHDPSVLYHAGNKVFKLLSRGDYYYPISEDISRQEVTKVLTEGSDAETYGTATALSESPLAAGLLWVGTDDGLVHVTTDDGKSWKEVTPKQSDGLYISHLEASAHDEGTAYCAIDGHRTDDFRAQILLTTNRGRKWQDISGDLPQGSPIRVVREDPANPRVLYCGSEHAAYVTFDRGQHWLKLGGKSLPTVPVYDLFLQETKGDLLAGTHGRSIYIMDDISCLAELPEITGEPLHLFAIQEAEPWLFGFRGYGGGHRVFQGANPPSGAVFTYWLKDLPEGSVSLTISNEQDQVVRQISGPSRPGLNRATWDLQADGKHRFANPRRSGPVFVDPGVYTVKISVDDESASAEFTVKAAPGWLAPEAKADLPPAEPERF